jgi:hypothetical protein
MMKAPIVDDASQVVEIIRQKSPSAELNLALEHKKPVTTDMLPSLDMEEQEQLQLQEQEEKKDDDRALAAADDDFPSLPKTASYVEEEGQEALWIDRSIGPAGEPTKRSLFKKTSTNSTPTTPKQLNILLLDSQANTLPPPPPPPPPLRKTNSDADKQREAAQKAETARKLLDQALSLHVGSDGQRELLAQSAFREATDARKLLEKKTSRELDTVLENAKTKGEAAAALARQMQAQEERTVAATITAEEDDEASLRRGPPLKLLEEQVLSSKGSADDHASRARQYLEFILPDVGLRGIPRATGEGSQKAKVEKMDDMSTLGFDNTYMDASPTAADPMDIFSIGSLNEILDGPMDKSPEKPLAKNDEPKKKRGGFFGGVFRKKTAKEEIPTKSQVNGPNEVMKVTGSKAAGKKKAAPKTAEKFAKGAEKEVKRFVATVMVEDGDGKTMEREISNIDELKKYQAVDELMERQLLEAMSNDDTESLTSHEGVRMHGKQTKPKQDSKKKSSKGAVEEPDPPQSPPRDYGKNRPTFVSVPQGIPGILMQKSWESLVENEAVPREEIEPQAKEAAPRTTEWSPKVYPPPPMDDAQAALAPALSQSPASSVGDMEKDKYTIPPDVEEATVDDRYAVVGSDCETFEYCWSGCGSGGLMMVRGDSAAVSAPHPELVTSTNRNATEDSDDNSGISAPIPYDALMTPVAADKNNGFKSPVAPRGLGKLFGRKPKVQENTSAPKSPAMPESAGRSTSKSNGTTAPTFMGKSKDATAPASEPASEGKSKRATALASTAKTKGGTAPPSAGKAKGAAAPSTAGKSTGVSAPPSVFKSNAASRWSSKPSEPASVPAEKTASKSPIKSKASSRSPKPSPTVKVAPLSSAGNNVKPKNRTSGVFGIRNTKETPTEIQRDTSTIRPVNISVVTTDSPTESKAGNAASFEPKSVDTRSANENEQDALPLLDQIKEQRNRPRKGLDPVTKDEPLQEQRGIDP